MCGNHTYIYDYVIMSRKFVLFPRRHCTSDGYNGYRGGMAYLNLISV